jgi:hypothetical protein
VFEKLLTETPLVELNIKFTVCVEPQGIQTESGDILPITCCALIWDVVINTRLVTRTKHPMTVLKNLFIPYCFIIF